MTTLNTLNVSPLAFLPAVQWYNHRRAYVYGTILPLVVPINRIPPFQISIDEADGGGVNWVVVNLNTGVETSIYTEMLATGYEGFSDNGRVILTYPGTVNLPGFDMTEDLYYIRFEDYNGNFIYSEIFAWQDNLDNNKKFVKVEWWHGENFDYPGGTIRYTFPFKMWVYLYTDIGKPERMKKEEVEERDGRKLPLKQISWKVFKFEFRAPEYLIDAMDLIWQHDACQVTHMGRVYEVEEFVMETEWLEYGDFAKVSVEFRTDTVVVVNGRSLADFDYEPDECFTAAYNAVAWIIKDGPEYVGKYYTTQFGNNVSFQNGDRIIIRVLGFDVLYYFLNGNYYAQSINEGETVICPFTLIEPAPNHVPDLENQYFFRGTTSALHQNPIITNEANVGDIYTISGNTFNNTIIEVWLRKDEGDVLAGTFLESDFTGAGVSFDASGSNGYYVRARTHICPNIGESEVTILEGIDFDEIGDTHVVYPDGGGYPIDDE